MKSQNWEFNREPAFNCPNSIINTLNSQIEADLLQNTITIIITNNFHLNKCIYRREGKKQHMLRERERGVRISKTEFIH